MAHGVQPPACGKAGFAVGDPTSTKPVDFDPFANVVAATLPLTEPQREIVAAVQIDAEASCAYNQCFVLRLRGPLSMESMTRALAQVVDRHEALRLRIVRDGEAQEILESVAASIGFVDLAALD